MRQIDVLDSIAIADDPLIFLVPAPVLAKYGLKQPRVRTSGHSVYSIVRAHEGTDLCFPRTCLEWGHIILHHVSHVDLGIELVPKITIPVFHIVAGEMLARGYDLLVRVILVSLQTTNQVLDVASEMEGILSGRFCISCQRIDIFVTQVTPVSTHPDRGPILGLCMD